LFADQKSLAMEMKKRGDKKIREFRQFWKDDFDSPKQEQRWVGYLQRGITASSLAARTSPKPSRKKTAAKAMELSPEKSIVNGPATDLEPAPMAQSTEPDLLH